MLAKGPFFKLARWTAAGAVAVGCAAPATDAPSTTSADIEGRAAAPLPAEWPNNGSTDCRNNQNSEPSIYVFKYDPNTWILRENKCLNFEANFIYLLFGSDKVLMQDTGSIPSGMSQSRFSQLFPIRDKVEGIIAEWLAAHPNQDGTPRPRSSIELLVTHSHSHGDHVQGDYQFRQGGQPFPHTKIAGLRPAEVASFFGITDWPNKAATLDLGGRKLDVLGIPGHEASHVAIYDHGAQLLLTGDSLYPGHLFVRDWSSYRASMARLNALMHEKDARGAYVRPVTWVLGTHIEKKPEARQFYPYPSWIHDPERKLELLLADLELLAEQTQALGATSPHRKILYDNFAIDAQ
jgi:hydroxyacylglutathione hydrolase